MWDVRYEITCIGEGPNSLAHQSHITYLIAHIRLAFISGRVFIVLLDDLPVAVLYSNYDKGFFFVKAVVVLG